MNETQTTWKTANNTCNSLGGSLLAIQNQLEQGTIIWFIDSSLHYFLIIRRIRFTHISYHLDYCLPEFFFIIKDYILSLVNLKTPGLWIDLNRLERETFRNQNNKPLLFTNWDRDQPKSQQRVQPLELRGSLQYKVVISFIIFCIEILI